MTIQCNKVSSVLVYFESNSVWRSIPKLHTLSSDIYLGKVYLGYFISLRCRINDMLQGYTISPICSALGKIFGLSMLDAAYGCIMDNKRNYQSRFATSDEIHEMNTYSPYLPKYQNSKGEACMKWTGEACTNDISREGLLKLWPKEGGCLRLVQTRWGMVKNPENLVDVICDWLLNMISMQKRRNAILLCCVVHLFHTYYSSSTIINMPSSHSIVVSR